MKYKENVTIHSYRERERKEEWERVSETEWSPQHFHMHSHVVVPVYWRKIYSTVRSMFDCIFLHSKITRKIFILHDMSSLTERQRIPNTTMHKQAQQPMLLLLLFRFSLVLLWYRCRCRRQCNRKHTCTNAFMLSSQSIFFAAFLSARLRWYYIVVKGN